MCCDTQKNLRYQKLRSHLNELGYLQPLDTDSLLLVEHLLADYLHTTEKLKYFKETAQNSIRACHNLEISVEPYKSDNAKLVSQVNSLHNQILEQKTKHDEVIHDLRSQLRRLEVERSEVEDLVSLQTSRIQELELESQSKNERLLQLQGLDLKPVISTSVGSKKRSAPLASKKSFTHLEIDPGVRSVKDWQDHYAEINRLNEDPVVVDLVLLTEKRCQKLEKTIKNVEEEKRILYSELELFAKKIADRDSEIDRLQRQVSGGRPAEAVNRDFYTEDSVLSGGDINSTMSDCSSKSVSSKTLWLQQRLEEAIQKQHEAMCHAMRLADHNRMLEAQLKCFLDAKCHCPPAPYSDLNKSSRSDSNQNESLQESFNNGLTELNRRIDELMADNDALKRTSEKSAEEKKKLTNKINELTIVENKLTQEISRLSKINAAQRAQIVDLEDRKDKCKCRKVVQGNLRKASSGSFRTMDTESFKIMNKCRSVNSQKNVSPVASIKTEKSPTLIDSASGIKTESERCKQKQTTVNGCPLTRKSVEKSDRQSQDSSASLTNRESRILCMYDDMGKNCQNINKNSNNVYFVRESDVKSVSSEDKAEAEVKSVSSDDTAKAKVKSVDRSMKSEMQAKHATNEMALKCDVSGYDKEKRSACPVSPNKKVSSGPSDCKHNPETKPKSLDNNFASSQGNYGCKSEALSIYHDNKNTSESHGSCLFKAESRSVQPQNLTTLSITNGHPNVGRNSNTPKKSTSPEVIKCSGRSDARPSNQDDRTRQGSGSRPPNSGSKSTSPDQKNGEEIMKCKINFDGKSSDEKKVPGFMSCARKLASKSHCINSRNVSCIASTLQRCRQKKRAAECKRTKPEVVKTDSSNYKPRLSNCRPANSVTKAKIRPQPPPPLNNSSAADRNCSSNGGKLQIKTQSKTSGTGRFGKRNEKTLPKLGVRVSKLAYKTPGNRRKSYSDLNSSENKDDSEPADLSGNLSASEESHVDSNDHVFGTGDVQKLLEGERKKYEEQIEFLRREQAEHFARLQTEKTKETVNQTPSAVLELLLKEKNYYQTEFHRLLEKQMHDRKDETGDGKAPVSKTSDEMINKIQNEIHKSTHETLTDLITKLNEKEKEILELKHSMQQMTSEKGTGDYFGKQNTLIRSLELEKDLAKRDVKRLEEEKATLINQLSNIKDGQRLGETRISHLTLDFEDRIRKLELERSELISRQASTNLIIENLEHEIDQYRKNLVQSQQEISEQKSLYNHLKLAHEQAERALREFQNNQGHLNQELSCNLDRIQMMETEVATLDRELQNVKIERNNLRTSVKQLDQQKDFLLCKLDDKTERIASMEKEIMKNETVIRQYETTIADLHAKYNLALSDNSKTEESVRRAHNEVENLHKQIKELETTKENLLSENKRIMNDLTTITQEYSSLRAELERSKKEVRELKQQLQLYVDSVKRYEDELSRKEQERSEMLEQFRNLSEETAALEQTNYQVETEVKKTHSSLREAESRVDELQKFIEDKEKKINRYHEELNELRFQLSHLEMETSSLRDEKSRMESDLYASRDLSTIVTSKNDHLVEQLNALTSHKVAMEAEISVLKDGMDDISKKYRESSREMQLMHSQISGYEKELASEVQVNEKLKREVAVLTKQLNELQNNLQSKSTELDRIEKESADHNQEITQLRREVVNARYEQTRADEARSSSQTL